MKTWRSTAVEGTEDTGQEVEVDDSERVHRAQTGWAVVGERTVLAGSTHRQRVRVSNHQRVHLAFTVPFSISHFNPSFSY